MSDAHTTTSGVASPADSLVAVAALASVLWVGVEFAFRRGLSEPIGSLLGSQPGGLVATLALTGIVLAPAVALLGARVDVTPADWGLSPSTRGVLAGIGAVVAYYAFAAAALTVYASVFGGEPGGSMADLGFAGAGTGALVALVVVNGVLAPIAEEVAWRGVIQTALVNALGTAAGIAITAALFVAKHVVVDLGAPPLRLASLAFLAIAFGVLRHRHGTASSTVAHVLANTTATATIVLA